MGLPESHFEVEREARCTRIRWRMPLDVQAYAMLAFGGVWLLLWFLVSFPHLGVPVLVVYLAYLATGKYTVRVSPEGIRTALHVVGIPLFSRRFSYACEMNLDDDWDSASTEIILTEGRCRAVLRLWGRTKHLELRRLLFDAVAFAQPLESDATSIAWRAAHFERAQARVDV